MQKDYLLFISHKSEDNQLARQLYDILIEGHPEWENRIFLDCSRENPLANKNEWQNAMMKAVEDSRHLIFVTSKVEYLKEGNGWVFEEVRNFQNLKANRHSKGRSHKNVSYIGIFLCDCNYERDLYSDAEWGSTYRTIYNAPEHLMLGENASLLEEKARVLEKVSAMVAGTDVDDLSLELLQRVKTSVQERVKHGTMLAEKSIDNALLPPLCKLSEDTESEAQFSDSIKDTNIASFDQLVHMIQENNVQIIGREGGSGKTTLMTKIFYHQLQLCSQDFDHNMIPLFVEAKALAASNTLIRRYLAYTLLDDHDAMNATDISSKVKMLDTVFSIKRKTPRYMLLIDGYNELPERSVKLFAEELRDFLPGGCYESVRVVMAGRTADCDLPEGVFRQVEVQALKKATIYGYLHAKNKVSESLLRILSNPMYLKLYTDTGIYSDIRTRGDLLSAFLDWQESKDTSSAKNAERTALRHILLRHVLPTVAYHMMTDNQGNSSFVLAKRALVKLFKTIKERITDTPYWMHYPDSYSDALSITEFEEISDANLYNTFVKYFVDDCRLLHQDSNGNFDFSHQIYRDFFCAWYIAEDIRIQLDENQCSSSLSTQLFDGDVIEFAADLLKERVPHYRRDRGKWDYSCNEQSCLVQMLRILRQEAPDERVCIANILMMLRYARWKDLSGLDLSGLDLTAADLQGCTFSHFDQTSTYSTNFANAKINQENLLAERHYHQLRTACTNDQYIACLDMGGFLKLWEKTMYPKFPVQVLTDLRCAITKLMFAPDGTSLYAMTLHEILEVPLPDRTISFISRAEPKRLFHTSEQLRDIMLDDQGQMLFATHTNPFNYKRISDPDATDQIGVYRIASAAAVCADGSCLACGTIIGHDELVIYDRLPDGNWRERQFGFGRILDDYIEELKNYFCNMGLHNHFYQNSRGEHVGDSFFPRIRDMFMDRTHHYETLPATIVSSCESFLKSRGVKLNPEQKAQLVALEERYVQRIKTALDDEGILIHLCGRRITGLGFHSNNKTLLLSGTINYGSKLREVKEETEENAKQSESKKRSENGKNVNEKISCSNWVVTLDKDTLDARIINMHRGENPNRAFYCGNDIVVMTRYQVNVYDEHGAEVALLRPDIHRFRRFINIPGTDTCYVLSNHNIYQMDRDLRCIRSIRNRLNETNLTYLVDAQGGEYLAKTRKNSFDRNGKAIDLHNGEICECPAECRIMGKTGKHTEVGTIRFDIRGNNLVVFDNGVEKAKTAIHHSLYICGCNFRGVTGSVAQPMHLQTLYRMGAETDSVALPKVELITDVEGFAPADVRYGLQRGLPPSNYIYREGMIFKPDCRFKGGSDNRLSEQKTWEIIRDGTASGVNLDAADYSILEWVDRLRYATPDMIHDLVEAGLIPRFRREQSAKSRVAGKLHTSCKFLRHSRFFLKNNAEEPLIATVNFPFGAKLLTCITGEEPEKQPVIKRGRNQTPDQETKNVRDDPQNMIISDADILRDILRVLALNNWFCATARHYRSYLEEYALHNVFETNLHFDSRAKVNGYLCLGGQPFFAEAVRGFDGEKKDDKAFDETISKVMRLALLALYYRDVVSLGNQLLGLKKQPVLVLICESVDQCCQLNAHVQDILPQVRKLYTTDSLLAEKKAGAGSYFEFCKNEPRFVRLESFLR